MTNLKNKFSGHDWTVKDIQRGWDEIRKSADSKNIDYYEPQIEIISGREMIEIYTYGLPIGYPHWSFGLNYDRNLNDYKSNPSQLAYEVIVNTNPSICYIMETNSLSMQLLVLAHAAIGHSHVFKNNWYFKSYTDPKNILNVLVGFSKFIEECEVNYGEERVRFIIDAGHALARNSVTLSSNFEGEKIDSSIKYSTNEYIFENLCPKKKEKQDKFEVDERDILGYICENSIRLEDWEKNILMTLKYIETYFYPQLKTKILNEGFATACQYDILQDLYNKDIISDGIFLEHLHSSSSVCTQAKSFRSYQVFGKRLKYFEEMSFNPYALGWQILKDIKRICNGEQLLPEDRKYFEQYIGKNYLEVWKEAIADYRDSDFIHQFMSPRVMRYFQMATVFKDSSQNFYVVDEVSRDERYLNIKNNLSNTIDEWTTPPDIRIVFDNSSTLELELQHRYKNGQKLYKEYGAKCLDYIKQLMGYNSVSLNEVRA